MTYDELVKLISDQKDRTDDKLDSLEQPDEDFKYYLGQASVLDWLWMRIHET